jgi:hypothetical protein
MSAITLHSTVVAAPRQVSSKLGSEAVILELTKGRYYGVNPVGAAIWQLIQQPQTVEQIREALIGRFDVEAQQCEADVLDFLSALQAAYLIEVRDAPG